MERQSQVGLVSAGVRPLCAAYSCLKFSTVAVNIHQITIKRTTVSILFYTDFSLSCVKSIHVGSYLLFKFCSLLNPLISLLISTLYCLTTLAATIGLMS